MLCGNRSSRNL